MSLTLNSAGGSAADSILKGLPFSFIVAISTMDANTFDNAWLDAATGIPGTTSLGTSSPLSSVTTRGTNGTYTAASRQFQIGSSTGLSAGDFLFVSHASLTGGAGLVEIESIPNGSTVVIVPGSRFAVDATAVSFQVAWRFSLTAGTAPSLSGAAGTQNFFKARASDSVTNQGSLEESVHYVKDAPVNAQLLAIQGLAYNAGSTTNDNTPTISIIPAFGANNGGISHMMLANHSVQAVNDATWADLSTTEKTFASAIAQGLAITGGSGLKYGQIRLRTKSGSANALALDWFISLDTTAPVITFTVVGR